jgi:hypothetical protein
MEEECSGDDQSIEVEDDTIPVTCVTSEPAWSRGIFIFLVLLGVASIIFGFFAGIALMIHAEAR